MCRAIARQTSRQASKERESELQLLNRDQQLLLFEWELRASLLLFQRELRASQAAESLKVAVLHPKFLKVAVLHPKTTRSRGKSGAERHKEVILRA